MLKKAKIVIADDDAGIRATLTDILTERKYAIEAVENGYELLANLKNKSYYIFNQAYSKEAPDCHFGFNDAGEGRYRSPFRDKKHLSAYENNNLYGL